jgi:putative flippase GtrA
LIETSGSTAAATEKPEKTGLVLRVLRDERVRYLMTGGIAAAIFYSIFLALYFTVGNRFPYVALVLIANTACAFITFRMYRDGVFRTDTAIIPGFVRFYVLGLTSLVGSATIVPLLVEVAGVPVAIAPIIYIAMQPLIFYPINKFWVFRARKR